MLKYNKIISPILMVIITSVLMFIICGIVFLHAISISSLKDVFSESDYYDKVEGSISSALMSYMSKEQVDNLIANNRVKSDINKLLNSIKENILKDEENYLKSEFKQDILNTFKDINNEDKNMSEYLNKVSNAYFLNLFPTTEISLVQDIIIKIKDLIIFGIIISCVCLVLCVIYLLNAGKQNKWLFVSIYNCIILCLTIIVLLSNFTNIYYSNEAVTGVLQGIISNTITDVVIITIVLVILVALLNYLIYFKKFNKHE